LDASDIIHELTHAEGLPKEALRAAAERRGEIAPLLVREIEDYLALEPGSAGRAEANPLFFCFHLLGDWRETSAYRPLARLLRCPAHEIDAILGDGITGTSHRVMAAVFDGDPQPLYDIILDPDADEFVRSRMCEALAMAVLRGELDRTEAARFLRDAFMHLRPQATCFVWNGWQCAIAMLGLSDLKSLVKKAFDRRYIDPHWLDYHHFEEDLRAAVEKPGEPPQQHDGEYTLFGNTIEELSTWHGFREKDETELARRFQAGLGQGSRAAHPAVNPHRGVGRNDPCPCGSGRKFKRCCLH
jgi:hypothetical protein